MLGVTEGEENSLQPIDCGHESKLLPLSREIFPALVSANEALASTITILPFGMYQGRLALGLAASKRHNMNLTARELRCQFQLASHGSNRVAQGAQVQIVPVLDH